MANERIILASELAKKGLSRAYAVGPHAALGVISGSGPSKNRKTVPNEDSIALHQLAGGAWLGVVADSHFGGRAGEVIAGGALREFSRETDGSARDRLERALRRLDVEVFETRMRHDFDRSATTALLVHVDGRELSFVDVGDSLLYVVDRDRCTRVNDFYAQFPVAFVGDMPFARVSERPDGGVVTLEPGQVVVVATDGIEPDTSELEPDVLVDVFGRSREPMVERVKDLLARADSRDHGGCRDNLGVVAIEIPAG